MDATMQLSRTIKGQEEIFNLGHTLRPRLRHILFSIGNGIAFSELCRRLPHCAELEAMVNELLHLGFIQTSRGRTPAAPQPEPAHAAPAAGFGPARSYMLECLTSLVGTQSPAYRKLSEAHDLETFRAVLPMCYKLVAAVASPHQAAEMQTGVERLLET